MGSRNSFRQCGVSEITYLFSGGLYVTPQVLPASCRQIVLSRIASLCRQHANQIRNNYFGDTTLDRYNAPLLRN